MNKVKIKILDNSHYVIKRLLNSHIDIYNIEYRDDGNIYTIDYDELENIPFEFSIVSFKGIKWIYEYTKIHKHFLISIFISILIMILMSNIIVDIDVIHSNSKLRELIVDELDENGIHPLIKKKSFNELQLIKKKILENNKDKLEWLEIIDDGMKYTIRVEERIITREVKKDEYCDIVSKKDATILSTSVSAGQEVVTYNDFVKKGSTLVSGAIKFKEGIKSFVCADAIVYGNTWYTVNVSMPYNHDIKNYTGKKKSNISFVYGSNLTRIFKIHYKDYDIEKKEIFTLGKFTLYKETVKEYIKDTKKYSDKEVYEEALKRGRMKILSNLDKTSTILSEKVLQSNKYNSIIDMEIFYSVKEIIGTKVIKDKNEIGDGTSETS